MEKRIQNIIEKYGLSPNAFAQEIDVNRSTISHILSGRNKPSLDFILKITSEFKDVDIHWLLHGDGSFPKKAELTNPASTPTVFATSSNDKKKIQRIVVFYNDGTFEEYRK